MKAIFQRLIFTIKLYNKNGLANHAAAGAYGFLLSLAPILLLISFIILTVFKSHPQAIDAIFGRISVLDIIIDQTWLESSFLKVTRPGISGLISLISIFWAGRIFALSIQRGLKIIFTGAKNRNPVKDTIITFAVEISVLLLVIFIILGSQTTIYLIRVFDIFPESQVMDFFWSNTGNRIFYFALLGLVSFCAYIFIPCNAPRKSSALKGAFYCALGYGTVNTVLQMILNHAKYNLLYGTLGNLIIILVNVYFYFIFLFMGAQLAYVIDSFDTLFFIKMRNIRKRITKNKMKNNWISGWEKKLFHPAKGNLDKYLRIFKKDEIIISHGDTGKDIYYILDGEAEIILPSVLNNEGKAGVLGADTFFGEIGYLLSEERCATIKAKTDVSVLILPPSLFDTILRYDTSFDRDIIKHMSRRLKNTSNQITGTFLKREGDAPH